MGDVLSDDVTFERTRADFRVVITPYTTGNAKAGAHRQSAEAMTSQIQDLVN